MKKITEKWLRARLACEPQIKLLKKHYPKGINVCWKCFKEADERGLDVYWLVNWLTDSQYLTLSRHRTNNFMEEEQGHYLTDRGYKLLEKYYLARHHDK